MEENGKKKVKEIGVLWGESEKQMKGGREEGNGKRKGRG